MQDNTNLKWKTTFVYTQYYHFMQRQLTQHKYTLIWNTNLELKQKVFVKWLCWTHQSKLCETN